VLLLLFPHRHNSIAPFVEVLIHRVDSRLQHQTPELRHSLKICLAAQYQNTVLAVTSLQCKPLQYAMPVTLLQGVTGGAALPLGELHLP
jgi:hypothetical protein